MTVLVTGATGNVGSELLPAAVARGLQVRALVHSPSKVDAVTDLGVEAQIGDFADRASLAAAMSGVRSVFLLAPTHPRQVEWEKNVIEEAATAGVNLIVKLSVINADPSSDLVIYRNHGLAEQALRNSGIPWAIARCNEFIQNFLLQASSIESENAFFTTGVGSRGVGMVDVRDIAAVVVELLGGAGGRGALHVVTGPEAVSFDQAAAQLADALEREISRVELPAEEYRQGLLDDGVPEWLADALIELYQSFGRGMADQVTDTVRDLTGVAPRSAREFARDKTAALLAG